MKIVSSYIINSSTIAIMPAKQIEYESIVIEGDKVIHVSKPPLQIIKDSCIHYWSTYDGRREAVVYHTGFKRKVPIPIHLEKKIITFPTHAIHHIDCSWIMYHHVLQIETINKHQTKVHFTNDETLTFPVSEHVLHSQMVRSLEVIQRITMESLQ